MRKEVLQVSADRALREIPIPAPASLHPVKMGGSAREFNRRAAEAGLRVMLHIDHDTGRLAAPGPSEAAGGRR